MLRKSTFALFVALAARVAAQTVVLTPATTTILPGGGILTFNATVVYSSPPSVLAFSATLPSGWSYSANPSSNEPPIRPADLTTGTLSWAYITTPASPATFSFDVHYPASLTGLQPLSSSTVTRDTAGAPAVTATGPSVALAVPTNTATWIGPTGNWNSAQWSGEVVPNNGSPANSTYAASISAGAVTVNTSIVINDLLFLGGAINGLSTNMLTISGSGSDWQAGAFSGLNQLLIAPGALFTASTFGNHDFADTTIVNQGQFIWRNGGALRSGGTVSGGAFVNAAGATFIDASSGLPPNVYTISNNFGGTFTFSNAGTYLKTGASATSIQVPFVNTGNVLLNAGSLAFTSTFTQTGGLLSLASGTTASFTNGLSFAAGSLVGSGTITGNVVNGAASGTANSAMISPGSIFGQLTILGNLSLLNTSLLLFDLGGTAKGATFDFLSVSGTAALGGTLALNLASSFKSAIQAGDSFTLLTASSISGAFTNVISGARLSTTDNVGSFLVNYTTNSLIVSNFQFTAVPEPSTWALLLLGTGALAVGARRRRS